MIFWGLNTRTSQYILDQRWTGDMIDTYGSITLYI